MLTHGAVVAFVDRAAPGRRVVFTNGVFDLLHPGHVRYLRDARTLGDLLIVGLNADESVRRNKGPGRPLTRQDERAEVLAALACVDAVVIFAEDTPPSSSRLVQPDVLVKGADWAADHIVGRDTVEARGGRVVRIPIGAGLLDHRDRRAAVTGRQKTDTTGPVPGPDSPSLGSAFRRTCTSGRPHPAMRQNRRFPADQSPLCPHTSSSLTLRSLLKSAASRLRLGCRPTVSGLTGPAKALFAVAAASRGRTVLVVPTDADVETMTRDARFFFSALEGCPTRRSSASSFLSLPTRSIRIAGWRRISTSRPRGRARCTRSTGGQVRLVVASAAALLPRVSPPDRLGSVAMTLTPGQDISPLDLADLLAGAGLHAAGSGRRDRRVLRARRRRGFLSGRRVEPIRLEFIGDTIESIRSYDPATQRSTAALDQAAIAPLQELLADSDTPDRSATAFDYLWSRGRSVGHMYSEPDEVRAQGEKLTAEIQPATTRRSRKAIVCRLRPS